MHVISGKAVAKDDFVDILHHLDSRSKNESRESKREIVT